MKEIYVIATVYPLEQFGVWDSYHETLASAIKHIEFAYCEASEVTQVEEERFRVTIVKTGEGVFRITRCGPYKGGV